MGISQHLHEATLDSSDVEMLLDYISPSGNGKEQKSRKQQITVKPRRLELAEQDSDAKIRNANWTSRP